MSAPVRIGVVGAGRIGALHARTVAALPGARLVRVYDADPEVAAAAAGPDVEVARDEAHVLTSADVDAVVIASPTPEHDRQIRLAADAGKAIFCEKPVTLDLASTRAAMAAVEASGVPFQIGFNRRYDPTFAALAEGVRDGRIGRPEAYRGVATDPAPPPESYVAVSGGLYVDMAIHDFDLARWIMGEVRTVHALGRALTDPLFERQDDIDTSIVTLAFASGALGVIQNSRRSSYGHEVRVEVFGAEGKVVGDDPFDPKVWRADADGVHARHVAGFLDRFAEAYRAELVAFVRAVAENRTPTPGPRDAVRALAIAATADASRRRGEPVDLAEEDRT
jgi:myo-inositol 2-dehydrogenase/D-chiro-inositol 1-dehydrogenase